MPLFITSLLIAANWLIFIVCIETKQVTEASLGYFVTPLMQVLLGLFVLGERLRPLQSAALLLATVGVGARIALVGVVPWLALALAATFSFYALLRKKIPVDGLLGLMIETLVLTVPALAVLIVRHQFGWLVFGQHGWSLDARIMASGFVTAIPLLCFGQAARRLPMAVLGFLQFVSPTLQFAIAVAVFGEELTVGTMVSFAILWSGLGLPVRRRFALSGGAELRDKRPPGRGSARGRGGTTSPEGVTAGSQGLSAQRHPGESRTDQSTPDGVAASLTLGVGTHRQRIQGYRCGQPLGIPTRSPPGSSDEDIDALRTITRLAVISS